MALLNAFFELINAGCRIVTPGVPALTIQGVGRLRSSLGSEQFLGFAKRAACCVEAYLGTYLGAPNMVKWGVLNMLNPQRVPSWFKL